VRLRSPLEDELIRLLEIHVPRRRDRQLVQRILGWDGLGGCWLAQAGDEFGITRERVRQIYNRVVEQIRSCELGSILDEVLAFVHRRRNRAAQDIEAELQLLGFTRHRFGMWALWSTARVFGRAPKFVLEQTSGKLFVVAGAGVVRAILKAAGRSSSRYGVQTVAEMCSAIAPDCRGASDRRLVREVLETRRDLRWLDAREQWFWLASIPRNPMVRCIKKLLQFAGSVRVSDIQRAVERLPRKRRIPVPLPALVELCAHAPFCRVCDGWVEIVGSLGPAKPLSGAEAKVCRILKRNGNELKFGCLEALCAAAGVSRTNLWRVVLYSPLIFRRAPHVYSVIAASSSKAEAFKEWTA
jgi:Sigma-70, region 4